MNLDRGGYSRCNTPTNASCRPAPSGLHRMLMLLAAATIACAPSSASARGDDPVPMPQAVDTARRARAGVDVSGAWATGRSTEPADRRVSVRPECNVSPALWILQQRGDTVSAFSFAPFHAQGVPSSPVSTRVAEGRVSGMDVNMRGAGGTFVLRYDSTSGHLRGTLNGAPFWAIPLDVVRPEHCIPIP